MSDFSTLMEKQQVYLFAEFVVNDIKHPIRIDRYLHQHYPETARTQFQKQISEGLILHNGVIPRKGEKVHVDDEIKIYTPYRSKIEWLENDQIIPDIIFEDSEIIVINKPAGLQIHPASGNYNNTLINGLLAYVRRKNEEVFLVHRLDKFTSGLIVFAKNEKSQEKLSKMFSEKIAKRKYYGLVWGKLSEDGSIDAPIARSKNNKKRFEVMSINDGGKKAITHFKVLQSFSFQTFLECDLETGRTHQIRVHMMNEKHPLIGDWEYGGDQVLFGIREEKYISSMDELLALFKGQALVAKELSFPHPLSKEEMHFEIDLPENFRRALDLLEKLYTR